MVPFRIPAYFLLRLMLIYAVLALAWLVVGDSYRTGFQDAGEWSFGGRSDNITVLFLPLETSASGDPDTLIQLRTLDRKRPKKVRCSSRILGYAPTVVLLALVLASPISRLRRLWAAILGVLLVCAFVEVRVGLLLLDAASDVKVGMITLSPWVKSLVGTVAKLAARIPSGYVVPVFIWMIVAFRAKDWSRIASREL